MAMRGNRRKRSWGVSLKEKQGIGLHGELLAELFPRGLRKDAHYAATVL